MTIDEAIKHAEEVAKDNEIKAKNHHEDQVRKCKVIPHSTMDYTQEYTCRNCATEHRQLAEWLKDYKRLLEQEPKWIPVSERLPNDRRPVLVTAYWHETYQVMMASYFGDGLWWCVPFNNCGKHEQKLNPKAWLPLPEPYKAESEEV